MNASRDKQRIIVSDNEIDKMIHNVFERQHLAEKQAKVDLLSKDVHKQIEDTRDERSLNKYNQMLHKWRRDTSFVSKRLKRSLKDTVIARADSYRRRKEICDKLESK